MTNAASPRARPRLRFGLFEVDPGSRELFRKGRPVALQEKPFRLLMALLARPGELVTREELAEALWPGDAYVEVDAGLNTAVRKLRISLGDVADEPRFVETMPQRGYRWIAPVSEVGETAAPAPPRRPPGRFVLAGLASASAVTLALLLSTSDPPPTDRLRSGTITRITSAPGLEHHPSWSPDGVELAYSSNRLGPMDVWRVPAAGGPAVRVTRDHDGFDGSPAFAPDGRAVAFTSSREGGGIYLQPLPGGEVVRLHAVDFAPDPEAVGSVPRLTWSPDGRHLAFAHGLRSDRGLYVIEVGAREVRRVPLPAEILEFTVSEPAWSPDGELLAFTELTGVGHAPSRIWVVRPDGGDLRPVTDGHHLDRNPAWWPAGGRILFVSDRGGMMDLWSTALDGTDLRPLTRGADIDSFALSPDGRRVAYARVSERSNLFSLEVARDRIPRLAEARALTSESERIESVAVSASGEWLAFDSDRSGNPDIWVLRTDGAGLRRITHHLAGDFHPSFSPDGTRIAFHSLRDNDRNLFVVSSAGGIPRRLTSHPGKDWLPEWSPDGELIAFGSDRSGNRDVWTVSVDGGGLEQMTFDPTNDHNPIWSRDGEMLLFSSDRGGSDELYEIPVGGGSPRRVTAGGWLDLIAVGWGSQERQILVWGKRRRGDRNEVGMWSVDLEGGESRPLVHVDDGAGRRLGSAAAAFGRHLYLPLWERTGDLYRLELVLDLPGP